VQTLLHGEGYTIKGVQRLHREQGIKRLLASTDGPITAAADQPVADAPAGAYEAPELGDDGRERLTEALDGLLDAKRQLDALLRGR
jgi:hypothetical protein